jgi:hypothetical protein
MIACLWYVNVFMKTITLCDATRLDAYLEFWAVDGWLGSSYIPRIVLFVFSEILSLLLSKEVGG